MVDDGRPAGQTFRWAYACILETHSAHLSILFERFDGAERAQIAQALEQIGASQTLADLRALGAVFDAGVAAGLDPADASELLTEDRASVAIGRRYQEHVKEMEAALLDFCRRRVDDL
jgi:2-keto-4-pentenoate hydratase/2-oxohepta-3-ene-1,7-dioic acid hydratase in catechol pathway